jgi:hypothetical protein
MPSPSHEVPIELLRKRPELLVALLEKLAGAAPQGRLEADDATLRFAHPAEVRPALGVLIAGRWIEALLSEEHPELAFFAAWAVRNRRGPVAMRVLNRAVELTDRLPDALREVAWRAMVGVL